MSWATAWQTEARAPAGAQQGGQFTRGDWTPAGRQRALEARNQAARQRLAQMEHRGKRPPLRDHEDQDERGRAEQMLHEAAQIEAQIKELRQQLRALTHPGSGKPGKGGPGKPGKPGKPVKPGKPGKPRKPSRRTHHSATHQRESQLRAQITHLESQATSLRQRAHALLRDAGKAVSPQATKGSRVAVLAPEASKAATLDGDVVHAGLAEIVKWEEGPDGTLYVYGKATTPEVDTDEQIVDSAFSAKALQDWLDVAPTLRVQHNAQRDPAGSGVRLEVNRDGDGAHWIKGAVDEPVAQRLVKKRHLRAFSVGIAQPVIERDVTGKARGGIIKGGKIVEVSLVDSPANRSCFLEIAKAASDGHAEFTGKVYGADLLTKDSSGLPVSFTDSRGTRRKGTVTLELPKNMSLSIKPSDLARLATFKQDLVLKQAAARTPAPGGAAPSPPDADPPGLAAIKATEAAAWKRDIDTATRRRLASEGRALPDLSYPIETHEDAGNAVTLALSGHGDVAAARKLIRRVARKEGWQDILDRLKGKVATAPEVAKKKGKIKALCPGCGAKQNREHKHCPECGRELPAMAPEVHKNHDFVCLGCGKELDKGEKFCPECGKENPGHNSMADRKIPANTKAAQARKDRVAKGKRNSGKPKGKTPASASGAVSAPESPAGPHREPDSAVVEAFEDSAGMQDGDHEAPTHLEALTGAAKTARPEAAKGKKGKGKKKGKPFGDRPAPASGEDDDEGDGKAAHPMSDPEMAAAFRLKALNVPTPMGVAHDLTCPAFDPQMVAKCYPAASLATLDVTAWQAEALEKAATGTLEEAHRAQELLAALTTLKAADPFAVQDVREGLHKMFRDANPGPATFPAPTQIGPARYNRPYIHEGHAAPSPGQDPPNHARIPETGGIQPEDFRRGYLAAGHADESPANTHPQPPMPAPDRTGAPTSAPGRTYYRNSAREGAMHAMQIMHDHIAATFPDLCAMGTDSAAIRHPVPTPEGVPAVAPAPGTRGLGKAVTKAERRAAKARKAAKAAKREAAKARKQAKARRARLARRVLKGTLPLDQAQAKLGITAPLPEGAKTAPGAPEPPVVQPLDEAALAAAVSKAAKPLLKRIGKQDRALRQQRKVLDAIASQPDTSGAPFRGTALTKQASAAPAGPLTVAKSAEQAQANLMRELWDQFRTSPNPELREAAWAELYARTMDPQMTRTT